MINLSKSRQDGQSTVELMLVWSVVAAIVAVIVLTHLRGGVDNIFAPARSEIVERTGNWQRSP